MFVNRMPRYEILSEDSMATLDAGWRRIVSEIGIEFMKPEAVLDMARQPEPFRIPAGPTLFESAADDWAKARRVVEPRA